MPEHGLLSPAQTSLLTDQYELAMAASYHRRGLNEDAVFELFVRRLPERRDWLVAAGLGPALELLEAARFGDEEIEYLRNGGFGAEFLDYLAVWRFGGDVDAVPEGTIVFAGEPLLRVTAPRIDAQIVETLLLNQLSFHTAVATKAARVVLAAGSGEAVIDFSARRDHGIDAAMAVGRSSALGGCGGTSNVAAALRFGLEPVGTMAHSYVLFFPSEKEAFRAFLEDNPDNGVLLVDTYDSLQGVRNAIDASRETGVPLKAVRLDSGDLLALSRDARSVLDESGFEATQILASGDLDEYRIAELVSAGAPIDRWGVGTRMGTSEDAPSLATVYKLVAHRDAEGSWRGVAKSSEGKRTLPLAKQVFRRYDAEGQMTGDVIGLAEEQLEGSPLLEPAMRAGQRVGSEPLGELADRARAGLGALPERLRLRLGAEPVPAYPVELSARLAAAAEELAQ